MSSPPPPSAPLADRLAWLAAEARAEKAEAGRIAALLIEVFARLLTSLAGFAAWTEAGTLPAPEPRATTAPTSAITPAAPGLLPRLFGWLGRVPPNDGAFGLLPDMALPRAERPRTRSPSHRVPTQPHAGITTHGSDFSPAGAADADVAGAHSQRKRGRLPPRARAAHAWVEARLGGWRRLPASTAGPCFQNADFREHPSTPISLRIRNVLADLWPTCRSGDMLAP